MLNRREVLASGGAVLALPALLRAETPSDTDVVVIGAGAAGLAAARVLMKRGVRFELIEVRDRIGGRAETDADYFGVPVDFGCSELHNAKLNPWLGYARDSGIQVVPLPGQNSVFDGARPLDQPELDALSLKFKEIQGALKRACAMDQDVSVSEVIGSFDDEEWTESFRLWLGPISAGVDLEHWSVFDWCAGRAGDNWYAPQGFGALIAHFGRHIPVHLNTQAEQIDWSRQSVKVVTDRGTIGARAVIVTVPVNVLKTGTLRFAPALPEWKLRGLDELAAAHYTKVLLKFRRDIFNQPHGSWVAQKTQTRDGFSFWLNPGGHGVTQAIAGGAYALELELAGADVAVETALSALRSMVGSAVDRVFEDGTATVWGQDPYALGAWVQARPGQEDARETLLAPLAGRVFFAGEACYDIMPATAGGAGIVGDAVGRLVADML